MTQPSFDHEPPDDSISLVALAKGLVGWRWTILVFGFAGAAIGACSAVTGMPMYKADAIFIPQGAEPAAGGSAAALAAQLGVRVPSGGGAWGAPMYVQLLHSRSLLEPIATDSLTVAERGGARVAFTDLFEIDAPPGERRTSEAVGALEELVAAGELPAIGAVKVSVTTPWPSVSAELADRVVREVNRFNIQTRKSQAAAERQFVEAQAADAERALRVAESRLETFFLRNRDITGSPGLTFERDRLQRDVALRRELQAQWLRSREEARIREVRDIPVITVLEAPRVPVSPEPRGVALKTIVGGVAGGMLALLIVVVSHALAALRHAPITGERDLVRILGRRTFSRRETL